MVRIHQLDQDLMRPGWQAVENHRLSTRIDPDPRRVIDSQMDVSDPARHGVRPEADR